MQDLYPFPAFAVDLCSLHTLMHCEILKISNLRLSLVPGADVDTDRVDAYVYTVTAAGAFF